MRRVKRNWQQSGKLLQARKVQFFASKRSKNLQNKHAVNKAHKIEKTNYLRKIGRLPEEDLRFRKRR
jgi:hypothetical protein